MKPSNLDVSHSSRDAEYCAKTEVSGLFAFPRRYGREAGKMDTAALCGRTRGPTCGNHFPLHFRDKLVINRKSSDVQSLILVN